MLELPKKDKDGLQYLSYSQVSTFLKSPSEYVKKYIFKEPIEFKEYLDFGKEFGERVADNTLHYYNKKIASTLPRYGNYEREIKYNFGDFYLTGFIDSISDDLSIMVDYKTGNESKIKEYESDNYIQLDLYAAALKQETGIYPKTCQVILVERLGNPFNGEQLRLGENFWVINKDVNETSMSNAIEQVRFAAEGISDYYKVFKKLNV